MHAPVWNKMYCKLIVAFAIVATFLFYFITLNSQIKDTQIVLNFKPQNLRFTLIRVTFEIISKNDEGKGIRLQFYYW